MLTWTLKLHPFSFPNESSFNDAHEPMFLKATKENDTENISKWGIMITLMMMITLGDKINQGSINVKVHTNL